MIKKSIILLSVLCLLICFSYYLRINTKINTFDDVYDSCQTMECYNLFEAFSEKHPRSQYLDDYFNINNVEELFEKSDLIALVKYESRNQTYNVIETKVSISKIIKGSNYENITVYEPAYIRADSNQLVLYQNKPLLKKNVTYLVFLKKAIQDGCYNYVNTCLSIYPIKDKMISKSFKTDETGQLIVSLKEIEELDYFMVDYSECISSLNNDEITMLSNYDQQIKKYELFKDEIFDKLNIQF